MVRYKKQQDTFRCAPVSILNAMKWAGAKVSYNDWIDFLCTMCDCNSNGTSFFNFLKACKYCSKGMFSFVEVYRPTLKQLRIHIDNDGAVILFHNTYVPPHDFHASLLIGTGKQQRFALINGFIDFKGKTVFQCSDKTFQHRVTKFQKNRNYYGLFLTRLC